MHLKHITNGFTMFLPKQDCKCEFRLTNTKNELGEGENVLWLRKLQILKISRCFLVKDYSYPFIMYFQSLQIGLGHGRFNMK